MTVELCDNCEKEIIGYGITTYGGNRFCGRDCVVELEAKIARLLHKEQAADVGSSFKFDVPPRKHMMITVAA